MTAPAPAGLSPLPCPRCGNEPLVHDNGATWQCLCMHCDLEMGSREEAIAAWNRRAPSLPVPPAEAALRCIENLAIDAGAKIALVERITAALASAAEPTEAQIERAGLAVAIADDCAYTVKGGGRVLCIDSRVPEGHRQETCGCCKLARAALLAARQP